MQSIIYLRKAYLIAKQSKSTLIATIILIITGVVAVIIIIIIKLELVILEG